jgi:hypothetical protein
MTSDLLINSPWADHSGADTAIDRAEADRLTHQAERYRATRVIAAASRDTADARDLLAMIGVTPEEIQAAVVQRTVAA